MVPNSGNFEYPPEPSSWSVHLLHANNFLLIANNAPLLNMHVFIYVVVGEQYPMTHNSFTKCCPFGVHMPPPSPRGLYV